MKGSGQSNDSRRAFGTTLRTVTIALLMLLAMGIVPCRADAQPCASAPGDIVAWWPLDETAGSTALDIIGTNSGTYVGNPQPTTGLVADGLRFDGTDDYVVMPDSPLWAFGVSDFTIEFWVSLDTPASGTLGHPGDVFISHDEGPFVVNKWFLALSSTELEFLVSTTGGADSFSPRASFAPQTQQWYHLAVTRSGTTYRIYVDGILAASGANAAIVPNPSAPLTLGRALEPFGGFLNGVLDEVSIYHRALTDVELGAIVSAGGAGKCKSLTVRTSALAAAQIGQPYSFQLEALFGVAPLSWSLVAGALPAGITLSADGLLSGTPTQGGSFPITIHVSDGAAAVADRQLTLEVLVTLPPADIRIHKTSTQVVPGRTIDYFILVENVGVVAATDVDIHELLDADQFTLVSVSPPSVATITNLPFSSLVIWNVPILDPGSSMVLTYRARLSADVALGTEVLGPARAIRGSNRSGLTECFMTSAAAFGERAVCTTACALAVPCILALEIPPPCWADFAFCFACNISWAREQRRENYERALEACYDQYTQMSAVHRQPAAGPVDPNEKAVIARAFIQPDQLLVYPIHFENIGTVEAIDVFLTDVLDPNLDETTLQFLGPYSGTFDSMTRTVSWQLLGRNLQPDEGDTVMFSVMPKPGLVAGTQIRNDATIQFEVFTPISTNEVVNTIDDVSPACVVDPLPTEVGTLVIPISWSGGDPIGEVESFSVFVSTDAGPYVPFVQNTTDVSATFIGEAGKRYGFVCIARDSAGNVEVQAAGSESETLVNPAPCRVAGRSVVLLKSKAYPDKTDKLIWKWLKGSSTDKLDFGSPAITTTFNLLFTDNNGFVQNVSLPPNSMWADKSESGFSYRDVAGTHAGLVRARLKPGEDGKAKMVFKGRGPALSLPNDLSVLVPPVRVRLENDQTGVCWESEFGMPTSNTAELWKARY